MDVTGKTEVVGLFGYPVRHTASPAFQNAGFRAAGLDWIYLPFEVHPDDLGEAIAGIVALGFRGINLTIPHKQAVMDYLDEICPEAALVGAVNTVEVKEGRLIGYNTDGKGFVRSIKEEGGVDLSGKILFVMGAGGSGRAVAVQAALDGAGSVSICDSDESRAKSLVSTIDAGIRRRVAEFVPCREPSIREALQNCEIFVDATPLGMKPGDPMSIQPDWLSPSTFVYDLVYDPSETPLLRAARERGCRTQNGLEMLLYQGCIAFEIWTGLSAPVEAMRAALQKAVLGKGQGSEPFPR
jgi:shikimate dehydrogenase